MGLFWDEFMELFPDLERSDIKRKIFSQVFYSKTKDEWWKQFANQFKKHYPTVYKHILKWKTPEKDTSLRAYMTENGIEVEDTATALSISMMTLESAIFKDILDALYRKRISAIHIHDAIVIPATRGTEAVEADEVQAIMQNSYKKFGLYPSFDVVVSCENTI